MRYNPGKIEQKWRKRWLKEKIYEPDLKRAKKPFYNLMMFPYPSAEGLHIGAVRTFSGVDIYGRFRRMQGYDVFEPIGLDGFGIHSENYALKTGKHPIRHAKDSEKNFYRQLGNIGNGFAWNERLETYDPAYYRWTQWIFVQMFKRGLAYRKKQAVNWCSSCKTVLADEQVIGGRCERCDTEVVKKELEQWFFKITNYAERLLENLEKIDWPEPIKIAQRNWIGKSEGAEIEFEVRTKEKPNFVLLHGYGGSPEKDFLPWLKKEIEARGYRVQVPKLPHADKSMASEKNDMEALFRNVKFDRETVFLGHSLGAIVALKALEKLDHPIRKLILVGGFLEPKFRDHERPFATTFSWKFNFKKIKGNACSIIILHDADDQVIPYNQGQKLLEALGGELFEPKPAKSHFNGDREPAVLAHVLDKIKIFTTRPDTLFGATYMVLGPEHTLIQHSKLKIKNWDEVEDYIKKSKAKTEEERIAEGKAKTGVELKGVKAINPATKEEIPIWVADYVLGDVGTGAIMAVPAHDERDFEFAKKFNLPVRQVIEPMYTQTTEPGKVREGEPFDHRDTIIAIVKHWSEEKYIGLKWREVAWGTFITGGIEPGQTAEEAARMEIREETGLLHLKLVSDFGVVHGNFYHVPKKTNRSAHARVLVFELKDGEREKVSDEEQKKHEIRWLTKDELQRFLTPDTHLRALNMLNGVMAYTGNGILANSGEFSGMDSEKAKWEITKFVGGERKVQYRLRDWLISRQRYWGPPIPMIYCEKCNWQVVPEKYLPVELPYIKNFRPTGTEKSPLATVDKFWKIRCPKCKSWARRETDVSDTFLDSAWYYIGYLMKFENWAERQWLGVRRAKPGNSPRGRILGFGNSASAKLARRWLPVDMYIGGPEHAVLHLLYVRFLAMAFYDWGVLHFEEPFKKFRTHGLITKDGFKMSKSRGNVVSPDEYIHAYGIDAIRMYLAFLAPLDRGGDFRDTGIRGLTRFLERVWRLGSKNPAPKIQKPKSQIQNILHRTIKKVTEDVESLQYNTAISALMVLLNEFEANEKEVTGDDWKTFLKLLAPFAPFITEELWGRKESIHHESWPKYDPKFIREDTFELVIQVNGKIRGRIAMRVGVDEATAKKETLALEHIKKYVAHEPRKVIFVPNRLINFVV